MTPDRLVTALYALTLFVAASLLFAVQPMVARVALPTFGGTPSVWTACMLFFQVALLGGYALAHGAGTRLGPVPQALVFLGLLVVGGLVLPFAPVAEIGDVESVPLVRLLGWLGRTAGLPFLAIATAAPLLQRWYASGHRDPYFLYGASNAGSLFALAAYPLWIERTLPLGAQAVAWSRGFVLLIVLVAGCAAWFLAGTRTTPEAHGFRGAEPLARRAGFGWVALAAIPSSLLLGVTTYLTTDLAPVPLLWTVPLALYLISYIVAFGRGTGRLIDASAVVLPYLVMVQGVVMGAGLVQPFWTILHLTTFFASALVCHGDLARRRPAADRLTGFYLATAVGGALGGVLNGLIAPLVFDRVAEYPAAIVAACLVLAYRRGRRVDAPEGIGAIRVPLVIGAVTAALFADVGGLSESVAGVFLTMAAAGLALLVAATHGKRPVRFAVTVGLLLTSSGLAGGVSGRVLFRERSFFGVLRVTEVDRGRTHRLFHGSTLHGQQSFEGGRSGEPLTYFTRSGPVGDVFRELNGRPGSGSFRVAVTGVGAGSLAAYATPGQRWTFYEIDPDVVRVARDRRFFRYLGEAKASGLEVKLGDARLSIAREADRAFDLIVLDAFSSDAVPTHLLTREALALYLRKRADRGLILVNITNRYLDLAPVVAGLAGDAKLVARVRVDARPTAGEKARGKQGSIWAVLASRVDDLGGLARGGRWAAPVSRPGDAVWTDDFSNVLDHLRWTSPVKAPGPPAPTLAP